MQCTYRIGPVRNERLREMGREVGEWYVEQSCGDAGRKPHTHPIEHLGGDAAAQPGTQEHYTCTKNQPKGANQ